MSEKNKDVPFARYRVNQNATLGIVQEDNVRDIDGTIYGDWKRTHKAYAVADRD